MSLKKYMAKVKDFRQAGKVKHVLADLLVIAILTILCGGEHFTDMEEFGRDKKDWLEGTLGLDLSKGIPSHDTFNRVFSLLKPEAVLFALASWLNELRKKLGGEEELVAIDGKSLRSAKESKKKGCFHLVYAYATACGLVLKQKMSENKNEQVAMLEIIQSLELEGTVVALDAAGCQKKIANQIKKKKGEYILSLKRNHSQVYQEVRDYFRLYRENWPKDSSLHSYYEELSKGHGRLEKRRIWCSSDLSWFQDKGEWKGLKSIVCVEYENLKENGTTEKQLRYYLTSLEADGEKLGRMIRKRWEIESTNWILDVIFHEDHMRAWRGYAAENLALLNRMALNMLKNTKDGKSIKAKRKKAGWNNQYLLKLLLSSFGPLDVEDLVR